MTKLHLWQALLVCKVMLVQQAYAFDVGNPWFEGPSGNLYRVEFIFEDTTRKISGQLDSLDIYSNGQLVASTNSINGNSISPQLTLPGATEADVHNDFGLIRFTYFPTEYSAFLFDVGFSGEDSSGDNVPIFGASYRLLLSAAENHQFSLQFGGHYIPEFEFYDRIGSEDDYLEIQGQERSYELNVALLSTHSKDFENGTSAQLYYGPRLSANRSEGSITHYFSEADDRFDFRASAKEVNPFSLLIGTNWRFTETLSARIEGRFIGEESISFSFGGSF